MMIVINDKNRRSVYSRLNCGFPSSSVGRRHAHARCCEDKPIQDDQAADDVRRQSQHKELCKCTTPPPESQLGFWNYTQHVVLHVLSRLYRLHWFEKRNKSCMWRFLQLRSHSHKKGPNFARRDIQRCDSVLASSCSLICLKAGGAESGSESRAPLNQTQPEGKNWAAFEQQLTCLPAFLIWVSAAGGRISRVISWGTLTSDIKPLKTPLKNLSLCLCAKLK